MIGWLGDAYPLAKAAHVIFVIFWMAGLFMLPRVAVYQSAAAPGSPEDRLWVERAARLRRVIVNPSMIAVWLLGLALAFNLGFAGQGWLHVKLLLVLALSGYHGWASKLTKRLAAGERPYADRTLRLLNEVPAVVIIAVVVLAVVRPF